MRTSSLLAALALATLPAVPGRGQEAPLPPAGTAPALVLDPGGPAASVFALAFSPDGSILYVGGADKVVRRFVLAGQAFAPADPARLPPLRVPIGPGNAGAVNAVAPSPRTASGSRSAGGPRSATRRASVPAGASPGPRTCRPSRSGTWAWCTCSTRPTRAAGG